MEFFCIAINMQHISCRRVPNRVNKEGRAAGVLDNFAEGERYAEHILRKFVRNKTPEIMPSINRFFTNPK